MLVKQTVNSYYYLLQVCSVTESSSQPNEGKCFSSLWGLNGFNKYKKTYSFLLKYRCLGRECAEMVFRKTRV